MYQDNEINNDLINLEENNDNEKPTSSLVDLDQKLESNEEQIKKNSDVDKYNSKLITCLILFVIPILGPIIFLSVMKPKDKLIKSLSIVSIFGFNLLFIFFLLGFYKKDFWN